MTFWRQNETRQQQNQLLPTMSFRCGFWLGLLAFSISVAHAWSTKASPVSVVSRKLSRNPIVSPQSSTPSNTALLMSTSTSQHNGNDKDSDHDDATTRSYSISARGGSSPTNTNTSKMARYYSKYNFSVGAILASSFLNLLGFTMAGPITPALGQHFGLQVGSKFGSLTSAYPLGMLVGLFLLPQLSDKIGRKPVITISLFGSGLGLAAQALAIYQNWGLMIFLLTRVLTGCFAGSSPVSKAFLADVGTKQGKLPRYLALRDAAATMAFIVGPMLGGILFDVQRSTLKGEASAVSTTSSLAFVICVSAVASLAAAALVAMGVKEVPPQKQSFEEKQKVDTEMAVASCPLGVSLWAGVATVCVLSFLFNVGDSTFHAFFPSLLKEKLSLDTSAIGLAYTVFACISFAVSATVAGNAIHTLGPVTTCAVGLSAVAGGLFSLAFCKGSWLLAAAGLYYSGVPLYGPTIPTMLLQCVPSRKRGAVMGLDGAINTVGRVIAPLAMGAVYRRAGSTAAFSMAGMAVLTAAIMTLVRRYLVLRQRNDIDSDLIVNMKQA